jgi:glycine betaine/proline transport system ATP-binding protein
VVSVGTKYLGLITLSRLNEIKRSNPRQAIRDFLEPDIPTAKLDSKVEDLLMPATTSPYPMPVIDEDGELVGEISNDLLLSSMSRLKLEATEAEAEIQNTEALPRPMLIVSCPPA